MTFDPVITSKVPMGLLQKSFLSGVVVAATFAANGRIPVSSISDPTRRQRARASEVGRTLCASLARDVDLPVDPALAPFAWRHVEIRLHELVTGQAIQEVAADALRRALRNTTALGVPAHTMEAVRHLGLDPVRLIGLVCAYGGLRLELSANISVSIGLPDDSTPSIGAEIQIGQDVALRGDVVEVPILPETVVTGAVGRPLRDILSHPGLDPLDLRIASMTQDEFMSITQIGFDGARSVRLPELAPLIVAGGGTV